MGAYTSFYSVGLGQGAECQYKIYTLRYNYYEARMFEGVEIGVDHKSHHCQNLSIDYDKAVAKAKRLHKGVKVGSPESLNDFSPRSENYVWDGETLCFGNKYFGHKVAEMVKDRDALKYLAGAFGYPSKPRQADKDCLAYINGFSEVQERKAEIEERKAKANRERETVEAYGEKSDYLYGVGDKVRFEDAVVIGLFSYANHYGRSWCVQMKHEDHYLVTFTNSKKFLTHSLCNRSHNGLEVGDRISFKATVKGHQTKSMALDIDGLPSFPNFVAQVDVKQTQLKMPVLMELNGRAV